MASLTWAVLLLAGLTCTHAVGTQTPIENKPSIVQVEFSLVTTWRQQCVGSIITNYHLVSAASCFQTGANTRRIRAGTNTKTFGGVLREVTSITNHPSFGSNGKDGDLSIVRVEYSWWFGPTIQYIQILPQGFYIPANLEVTVGGWGITAEGGLIGNANLYSAVLQSKPITTCLNQYPGRVTTNMLCVGLYGKAGRDFDPSDAGAPVSYLGYLAGVSSFGSSANKDELPIVATAISAYSNWIVANAV